MGLTPGAGAGRTPLESESRTKTLHVTGITAGYGQTPVIQDISIGCEEGGIAAIVGPNGSGKSTLLKTLAGLLKPRSGVVWLQGVAVTGLRPEILARKGLAYVPQTREIFPSLTVAENLEMGGYTLRGNVRSQREKVLEILPDLKPILGAIAGNLSGGQRKLLGIGRVLMIEPVVLLLDEPTASLSPAAASMVWANVRTIAARGTAVVVVEQRTRSVLAAADWAYVIVAGRNLLEGSARTVLEHPEIGSMFLGSGRAKLGPALPENLAPAKPEHLTPAMPADLTTSNGGSS